MEIGSVENLALYQREDCVDVWLSASAFKYSEFLMVL